MSLLLKKICYILTTLFILLLFIAPTLASGVAESQPIEFNLFKAVVTASIMILLIVVIATERIHRTMVALLFGSVLIFISHTLWYFYPDYFQFLTLDQAFWFIHGDVIALLAWMMMIVWVLAETWFFQWIALQIFKFSKWSTTKLLILFMLLTALLSAILDNVTTMFLITPVAISISRIVGINPIAFLMPMIMAANVWWTATLIWDPPNIMIWAYAWLSFNQFLINLWIPVIFIMMILIFQMKFLYRKDLKNTKKLDFNWKIEELEETCKIKHYKLLRVSMFSLWFVILFFLLHWIFHMSAAVPALTWAAILMLLRDRIIMKKWHYEESWIELKEWILKAFEKDIEWPILAFFVFLFMIVWAVENSWLLLEMSQLIQSAFWNDLFLTSLIILWVAAIMSALLDNIPFTAVMLPVVGALVTWFNDAWMNWTILWWALAFWACFWGNWSLIWASSNIVTVWIMEKEWIKFSFIDFFKIWFPAMILQTILASFVIYWMVSFL